MKCKWFEQKLIFIRYRIIVRSIELDPRNIEKIKNAQVLNSTLKDNIPEYQGKK